MTQTQCGHAMAVWCCAPLQLVSLVCDWPMQPLFITLVVVINGMDGFVLWGLPVKLAAARRVDVDKVKRLSCHGLSHSQRLVCLVAIV